MLTAFGPWWFRASLRGAFTAAAKAGLRAIGWNGDGHQCFGYFLLVWWADRAMHMLTAFGPWWFRASFRGAFTGAAKAGFRAVGWDSNGHQYLGLLLFLVVWRADRAMDHLAMVRSCWFWATFRVAIAARSGL